MEISVNELKQLICGDNQKPQSHNPTNDPAPKGETFIVALDRGWVFVGKTTKEGDFYRIENARNIRLWGTTKGLGELRDGPTSATKLDDAGLIIAPAKSVMFFLKCNRDW